MDRSSAFRELALEVLRLQDELGASGDRLAGDLGLTATRWRVLAAVEARDHPPTVPQVARAMGLTRQAVQRSVDRLAQDGFLAKHQNPDHRRAILLHPTTRGRAVLESLATRQAEWGDRVTRDLPLEGLRAVIRLTRSLRMRIAADRRSGG